MRLKNLKLKKYLSYDEAEINLENFGKTLIVGSHNGDTSNSNGSGKTNLCESIGWCVWGKSKAKTIDLNVKDGNDLCSVELSFEHDGKDCKIIRSRNKNNSLTLLDFYLDGQINNGNSVTDTDKKIIDFIKIDYQTYINSVYLRQDDIYSLANPEKSSDGRNILDKVLNLEEYDIYEKTCKNKIKDLEKEILEKQFFVDSNKNIENKITEIQNLINVNKIKVKNLEETNILSLNKYDVLEKKYDLEKNKIIEFKNLNETYQDLDKRINEQKTQLEKDKESGKKIISERARKIESLNTKISEKPKIEKNRREFLELFNQNYEIKKLEESLRKTNEENKIDFKSHNEQKNNLNGDIILLNKEIVTRKNNIIKLEKETKDVNLPIGETCSVCMTKISEHNIDMIREHKKKEIGVLEKELEMLNKNLENITEKQRTTESKINELSKIISDSDIKIYNLKNQIITDKQYEDRLQIFQDKLNQISNYENELKNLPETRMIEMCKSKVVNLNREIEENTKKINDVKNKIAAIKIDNKTEELLSEIQNLKNKIEIDKKEIYTLHANIDNLENNLIEFNIILNEYKTKKSFIEEAKTKLITLNNLERAFSSKGIRAKILQDAINELEIETNSLLKRLTSGRLSLNFITSKETDVDGQRNEKVVFETHITDGDKVLPFSLFSGGEKFRISFVLRIALSKLLLRKADTKIEFLIIDEAFSSMDKMGAESIMEVINELQEEFKNILVISHREDVKNMFDENIFVYRDEKGSKIIVK